ncbi:MAG: WD40/YVTN/BNR-like repeat-containing protein, partial [Myxococcota bacterium]
MYNGSGSSSMMRLGVLVGPALVRVLHGAAVVDPAPEEPMTAAELLAHRMKATVAPRITDWAPPTEHWLGEDGEQRQKTHRKAWMKELHTAGSDVDYKAYELENGLAQVRKRNALAGLEAPPDGPAAQWVERGSDNNAGRMHVAVHSTDGSDLYAGSSRGGIWRRPVDGGTWEPLGDNLYGGTHNMVLFPADDGGADVILSTTDGGQINRSDDDGATWVRPAGLDGVGRVRRLIQASDGSHTTWRVVGIW